MAEKKFTPGPWIAVYRGCYGEGAEGDVHQEAAWDAYPLDSGFMRGEFKYPDACLIAAAPELYEALDNILKRGLTIDLIDPARAALAKARGE